MLSRLIITGIILLTILIPIHLIHAGNQFHIVIFDSVIVNSLLIFYIEHFIAYTVYSLVLFKLNQKLIPFIIFFSSGFLLIATLFAYKNSITAISLAILNIVNIIALVIYGLRVEIPFVRDYYKYAILIFLITLGSTTFSPLILVFTTIDPIAFNNSIHLLYAISNIILLILINLKVKKAP